jgi:uncharacterized protein (DUF1800 family)
MMIETTQVETSDSNLLALTVLASASALSACGGGTGAATNTALNSLSPAELNAKLTDASRFLRQATWGGTLAEIRDLASTGSQNWINDQAATPTSLSMTRWLINKGFNDAAVSTNVNGDGGWSQAMWGKLFGATDPLRQRATFALSELFVVSYLGLPINWRNFALANYWDVLEKNALGNYRDLLEGVTLSSAMGTYLNMKGSQKFNATTGRAPDENYSREVMQLFTIGLYELNSDGTQKLDSLGKPIETYDNNDVLGLARVFTGWDNATGTDPQAELAATAYRHGLPMSLNASLHSPEEKRFLDVVIPAGTDGIKSLKTALDALFNHNNTAPFVVKQLIQRLVTSNPSPA